MPPTEYAKGKGRRGKGKRLEGKVMLDVIKAEVHVCFSEFSQSFNVFTQSKDKVMATY